MSGKFGRNLKRKHAELISSTNNTTQTANNNSASVSVSNISENISIPEENQLKYHRCEKNVVNAGEHSKSAASNSSDAIDSSDNNDSRNQSKSSVQEECKKDDFLRAALIKIQELENELANDCHSDSMSDNDSDQEDDQQSGYEPEALGFAVCARETLTFLASQGLSQDNPIIVSLRNRLIGKCNGVPI